MLPQPSRLAREIRKLAKEMLPAPSPTASYTDREIMMMCAFRLLAHAEIEGFLEDCAEHLRETYARKNSARSLSPSARAMLLGRAKLLSDGYPPRTVRFSGTWTQEAQRTVNGFLNGHATRISQNNGVSEKDILKLLVPIGFELTLFDHDWLAAMSNLSRARGEAAHGGWMSYGASQQQPSPQGERSLVVGPMWGLRHIVAEVERLAANS